MLIFVIKEQLFSPRISHDLVIFSNDEVTSVASRNHISALHCGFIRRRILTSNIIILIKGMKRVRRVKLVCNGSLSHHLLTMVISDVVPMVTVLSRPKCLEDSLSVVSARLPLSVYPLTCFSVSTTVGLTPSPLTIFTQVVVSHRSPSSHLS